MNRTITVSQLRRFVLTKQGLSGPYRFAGKAGALAYIRQAGCIQFDPIDICGRNAELTLQSRVRGVKKQDLYDLLYKDHVLVDHTDKELSIFPVEDWPHLARWRGTAARNVREFPDILPLMEQAMDYITAHGPVSAAQLPIPGTVRWNSAIHWSGSWSGKANAARSALEQLYSQGDLIIHHKEGTRKFYDLASRYIPDHILHAPDPCPALIDHIKWAILRRMGAMGVLWDRRSDALLGVWGMEASLRRRAFRELAEAGQIVALQADGLTQPFYMLAADLPLLEAALAGPAPKKRCEFIAPLDPLMWDRQMVEAIFGFRYRWEIYVPGDKRQFGYYVLPTTYGDRFVGRVEAVRNRESGTLEIRHVWLEPGVQQTKTLTAALTATAKRLAKFNDCPNLSFLAGVITIRT